MLVSVLAASSDDGGLGVDNSLFDAFKHETRSLNNRSAAARKTLNIRCVPTMPRNSLNLPSCLVSRARTMCFLAAMRSMIWPWRRYVLL